MKTTVSAVLPQAIAIVGAGLVGSAVALALAEDGHMLTMFDPDPPGAGTSSGNAGGIVTGAVVPTSTPEVLRTLPSYVFDRNAQTVLRLRHAMPSRRCHGFGGSSAPVARPRWRELRRRCNRWWQVACWRIVGWRAYRVLTT